MKSLFYTIAICFTLAFGACKTESKEPKNTSQSEVKSLHEFMVGSWETTYIKIKYPTYQKADSSFVFEDDFSNPKSGRAQSKYNNDGTFTAWFKQPDSSKIGESNGKWKVKGDSLLVDYFYLGKQVQAWYTIQKSKNGFEGKVIYDWDNDGDFDDILLMKSKRIK